jgi:hypothetical protein
MNHQELLALLTPLGETSDQVCRSLKERGIKGDMWCGSSCPIANYLRKETGVLVSVNTRQVSIFDPRNKSHEHYLDQELPAAISAFIRNFDNRAYPELIHPGYDE